MKNLNQITSQTILSLATSGDCSGLSLEQKLAYYKARCEAAGLDARTNPLQFIKLQGREILYATKTATDQLSAAHGVVCEIVSQSTEQGIRIVVVRSRTKDGRQTDEIGCVSVEGLKGDALCNAFMKAITKAKRRAILSITGLGMLDETEIETIPGAVKLEPENFRKFKPKKWQDVVIHFGKLSGKKLGELDQQQLAWFKNSWQPKPVDGTISGEDADLRDA